MIARDSNKRVAEFIAEAKFHRVSNVILCLVVLGLIFLLSQKRESIILIPPKLDEKIKVSVNMSDSKYKKAWAKYVAVLAGNVTPANAPFVADAIGELLAPEAYDRVSGELGSMVFKIQKEGRRTRFTPNKIVYEEVSDKVFVQGDFETIFSNKGDISDVGRHGRTNTQRKVYEMVVIVEDGYPKVLHFSSYFGDIKDEKYLERQKRVQAKSGRD